ncbi:MAG: type I methionyl aminopeptidase [Candidatus Nealsonbacteria bacterium]|nr:type I methionyl aminopeptidase [Candidatus Nealsonbacteria bacterium]
MIGIKTKEEIEIMAEGGKLLSAVLRKVSKMVKPGISTKELDSAAESLIFKSGAKPSFTGHMGYPATLCTSVNEEVVHAVPSDRILKEGDIITLDIGLIWEGFHSDMAVTLPVGKINPETARLVRVTKKSLKRGLKKVRPGNTFGDIGNTIQRYVESQGFNVVRDLCGHGIGRELHEDPQVLNYGKRGTGPEIKEGMVFCIEPMVTLGSWKIKKGKDGHSYVTQDGSLSAHFEATIVATKDGYRLLTPLGALD